MCGITQRVLIAKQRLSAARRPVEAYRATVKIREHQTNSPFQVSTGDGLPGDIPEFVERVS